MDFFMDGDKRIEFLITPMDPKKSRKISISLEDFPDRPAWTTRIQVSIGFLDESTMAVAVRDKGFGELFPASGAVVRREVRL